MWKMLSMIPYGERDRCPLQPLAEPSLCKSGFRGRGDTTRLLGTATVDSAERHCCGHHSELKGKWGSSVSYRNLPATLAAQTILVSGG